jgi:hypothetical protein
MNAPTAMTMGTILVSVRNASARVPRRLRFSKRKQRPERRIERKLEPMPKPTTVRDTATKS